MDLLELAEPRYLELAHSPSNRELSSIVLRAIESAIEPGERATYGEVLDAFIESERPRLIALFDEYGPHGAMQYLPEYLLFGQAESLIILERLQRRPHLLFDCWSTSGMPEVYLDTLADAAGFSIHD